MRRNLWLALGAFAGAAAVAVVLATRFEQRREQQRFALFTKYCTDCHNAADFAGNLSFEHVSPETVPQHAAQFEAAIVKLRGRLMPPPGNPQPSKGDVDGLVATLERTIDEHAPKQAGYVAAQRLDRNEYANAVKALLDVDIDPKEYLPAEIEIHGFSNIAAALSTSPAFVEQYVTAAGAVAHLAVGEQRPKVANAYFPPPTAHQDAYVPGLPLGTRGGVKFTRAFPADGEYRLSIADLGLGLYPRAVETRQTLVVLVDRAEQFRADIGGPEDLALVNLGGAPARAEVMSRFKNIPLKVTAGTHEVAVTFIERSRAADDEQIADYGPSAGFSFSSGMRVAGILGGINMVGPFNSTGLTKTESRKKLFVCEPEVAARERECAQQITANLARRAFRRPVGRSDVDRLMGFFDEGRKGEGTFDEGIELMTTAVLASPDFLYRSIAPSAAAGAAAASHELTALELASRLSFFLWSQGPDDELLKLAESGELARPNVLANQVTRMLKDPRAEVLVTSFAEGWLRVGDLDAVVPDKILYPEFSEGLRQDFAEEIRLFLDSVLLADRNVQTLLTADYTFVNERLARHYGIDGVVGPQFRQVKLADPVRHGLLGKGAILLRTSYGNRTSPVLRGQWVLDKLMGTPPTPPPPGVETNLDTPEGEQPKTVRARLQQHRKNPTCAACHGVIDPYGLALENFTATGAWRTVDKEAGAPIDPHSELSGGRPIDGPAALTAALLARDDQFVQALTEKLMMYALGRELEYYDMPQVRAIVHDAKAKDYRLSALVAGIVRSDAFRMQAAQPAAESTNRGSTQASLGATGK